MILLRFVFSLIIILLILPMLAQADEAPSRSCLNIHVKEAIALNKERAPKYETLTAGRSRAVTNALVHMEERLLFQSVWADLWARPYQKAGIPILCADLIDMSETPAFRSKNPNGKGSLQSLKLPNVDLIKRNLNDLLAKGDYAGLGLESHRLIQQLDQEPRYNCLVKHMLESIRRFALMVPIHQDRAEQVNYKAPLQLSRILIKTHIGLLKESQKIDVLAAPLQAQGVMMVCQDVPYIPAP